MAQLHAVPEQAPRAVGYVRVSTYREEKISPELQVAAIEAHCRRRGYVLVGVHQDLDATGRNFARAEVQRTVERIEAGEAELIVVWKVSRFGRNRRDWYVNADRVELVGGRLESATEDFDAQTSVGRFTRGMLVELAAFESDRIGDVWREVHARRVGQGLPHSGQPRYGYERDGDTYRPHPEQAPVLELMYAWFLDGVGFSAIATRLNRAGHRNLRGTAWSRDNVTSVLDSGFAAGQLILGRRGANRGRYLPGAQQPIIDADTWRRYLAARERRRGQPPKVSAPQYVLTGLIRCGDCGAGMQASNLGMRRPDGSWNAGYGYVCGRWKSKRDARCVTVTRRRAEQAVLDWLRDKAESVEAAAAVEADRETARVLAATDADRLARQATRIDGQLDKLTDGWASGLVPDATYQRTRDRLIAERDELGRELQQLDARQAPAEPVQPVAVGLLAEWDTLAVAERRELLRKLIERVEVHPTPGRHRSKLRIVPQGAAETGPGRPNGARG